MNVQRISRAADIFLGENRQKLTKTIDDADALLTAATAAVQSGQSSMERLSARIETMLDENRSSVREVLDRAAVALRDAQGPPPLVTQLKDKNTIDEVNARVATVRRVVGRLDQAVQDIQGPGSSGRGSGTRSPTSARRPRRRPGRQLGADLVARPRPAGRRGPEATSRLLISSSARPAP